MIRFFDRIKNIETKILIKKIYSINYVLFNKLFYKNINFDLIISPLTLIYNKKNISLGKKNNFSSFSIIRCTKFKTLNYVSIGYGSKIYGDVKIGNYVMIGPNVCIMGGDHNSDLKKPMYLQKSTDKRITIEDDVWIGANVSITKGVIIRKGTIIGAGAVITKSTNPNSIVVGDYAKEIKKRN